MPDCPLAHLPQACFTEYRSRLLKLKHSWDYIPCTHCCFARQNAIAVHVPEIDVEPSRLRLDGTHTPGTKPKGACFRGHDRATYGRFQVSGRDKGGYACRECERVRRKSRKRKKEEA